MAPYKSAHNLRSAINNLSFDVLIHDDIFCSFLNDTLVLDNSNCLLEQLHTRFPLPSVDKLLSLPTKPGEDKIWIK